eukprot:6379956-Amphidinium_carterae.1
MPGVNSGIGTRTRLPANEGCSSFEIMFVQKAKANLVKKRATSTDTRTNLKTCFSRTDQMACFSTN